MKISELPEYNTSQENITLAPSNTVYEAVDLMYEHHIGAVPIFEDQKLVGIFSERDLETRVLYKNLDPNVTLLSEVMTKDPQTITSDLTVRESIDRMIKGHYRHSLVVDDGKLIQVISQRVFVANNWFLNLLEKQETHVSATSTIRDIIDSKGNNFVLSLTSNENIMKAVELITTKKIGAIPIIDNDELVGIMTERDIMFKVVHKKLDPNTTKIEDIMTKNPNTVTEDMLVSECLESMALGKYRHILIVNDDQKLIKILSQRDFMSLHM